LPRPSAFLTLLPCAHPQEQCLSNGTTTLNIKKYRHVFFLKVLCNGSNCKRSEHKSQHCKRIALREYHPVRPLLRHSSFFAQQKYITKLKNNFKNINSSNRHDRDQDDAVITMFGQKICAKAFGSKERS
jgi:hypothetical protein